MEQTSAPSTKGKGLGLASLIIGIVCVLLCWIPVVSQIMSVPALIGLILGLIGFFQAKNGGNPNKGMMIVGIILNVVAIAVCVYQIVWAAGKAVEAYNALDSTMGKGWADSLKHAMDTMH